MSKENYIINIDLKSDLCTSSGESLGSYIDNDVCYDKYGIPYIPAKRLKGLLREAALEYIDWSGEDKKIIENIFGKEDSRNPGMLEINNGRISHYNKITQTIKSIPKEFERYISKQRMVNVFTYVRYQTAVDEETGTSKDNSLRSTRIVKKGITFKTPIRINCSNPKTIELLKKVTKLITHMGINRTRGFGEVKCTLEKEQSIDNYIVEVAPPNKITGSDEIKQLKLLLKADSEIMVSKQNSEISQKYIPGSNILGSIARQYIKANNLTDFEHIPEEFIHLFLDGSVKYSNAYISNKEGIEFYPIPFSYAKVKNSDNRYFNKMFEINEEGIQLSGITDKYVTLDDENYIQDVNLSENYHHQRPKNKSFGHVVTGKDGGTLYQYNAISSDQYFLAKIEGKEKYLNILQNYLTNFRVGKSKTTEYGVLSVVNEPQIEEVKNNIKSYNNFAVILTSDTILLDSKTASTTTNKDAIINKIKQLIGDNIELQRAFINYEKVSGYNIIWNKPKEQVEAFKAGSVFVFKAQGNVNCNENYNIGQRQNEGYGQIKIVDLSGKNEKLELKEYKEETKFLEVNERLKPIYDILYVSINNVIKDDIVESAINQISKQNYKFNNATIGRMRLMLNQSKSVEDFENNINSIKDKKKLREITKMIENFKNELLELDAVKDLETLNIKVKNEELGISKEILDKYIMEYIKQCLISIKMGEVEE